MYQYGPHKYFFLKSFSFSCDFVYVTILNCKYPFEYPAKLVLSQKLPMVRLSRGLKVLVYEVIATDGCGWTKVS